MEGAVTLRRMAPFLTNGRRLLAALVILAAACDGSTTPAPTPPEFVLDAGPVWDGAEIEIGSESFATVKAVRIRAGDAPDSLPLRRLSATRLAVRLPSLGQAAVDLHVELDGTAYPAGTVSLRGYTGYRELAEQFEDLMLWPRTGASVITGNLDGILLLDLASGIVVRYPGTGRYENGGVRGPGFTHIDGVFVASPDFEEPVETWRLLPSPEKIATHPLRASRQIMQLNENAWVLTHSRVYQIYTRSDATQPYQMTLEETFEGIDGLYMSPRGDRATLRFTGALTDLAVFDATTATVAYRVAGIRSVAGADFSADGELLAIVGGGSNLTAPFRVMLLRASDGTVLREMTLDGEPFTVTLDPVLPLVYVGMTENERPVVLVLDRETFAVRGRLAAPASAPACTIGCHEGVIARSAEPALYVMPAEGPEVVYRYAMAVD